MYSPPGAAFGNDPVERFINRLARLEPLEPEAREAMRRAVIRGPLVAPYQELHRDGMADVSVVLSGWMCHFRLMDNGRRQITSILVPGDFGGFGFLAGNSTPLQSLATAPTQLGSIRIRHFNELSVQYPSIMRAALRAAATDAAIGREHIVSLGVRSASEKLSHLLCELWYRLSAVGLTHSDKSYDLPMTQAELGAALGLSTVHANRTIQALRKGGAISMHGGRVWIHDLGQLAALAGFDAGYLNHAS